MPSEELPTLDHGIPPPESFLPGTPAWYWWSVGAGGIVILLLLIWAYQILKPAPKPPTPPDRDLFFPAMTSLAELEIVCPEELLSLIAAKASLTIRLYLADAQSEPALYETAEEFEARQGMLPPVANALLNELADAKYAKSDVDEEKARNFINRSRECLRLLHQTVPENATPLSPPPTKRHFSEWILSLVPLGLAVALAAFLTDLYDGPDTGSEIKMNLVSWIALSMSTLGLLARLIFRPQP